MNLVIQCFIFFIQFVYLFQTKSNNYSFVCFHEVIIYFVKLGMIVPSLKICHLGPNHTLQIFLSLNVFLFLSYFMLNACIQFSLIGHLTHHSMNIARGLLVLIFIFQFLLHYILLILS